MKPFIACFLFLPAFCMAALAANLPACSSSFARQGNTITTSTAELGNILNQKLKKSGSSYSNLKLTPDGNQLKVSAEKNGDTVAIKGPLQATSTGNVQLHANEIKKDGASVEGLMGLFGEDLADRMNLQGTRSLSIHGNDLVMQPDILLGVTGHVTNVQLENSELKFDFATQPCR